MERFPYSSAPLKRVKAMQFGILGPEELVCPENVHHLVFCSAHPRDYAYGCDSSLYKIICNNPPHIKRSR